MGAKGSKNSADSDSRPRERLTTIEEELVPRSNQTDVILQRIREKDERERHDDQHYHRQQQQQQPPPTTGNGRVHKDSLKRGGRPSSNAQIAVKSAIDSKNHGIIRGGQTNGGAGIAEEARAGGLAGKSKQMSAGLDQRQTNLNTLSNTMAEARSAASSFYAVTKMMNQPATPSRSPKQSKTNIDVSIKSGGSGSTQTSRVKLDAGAHEAGGGKAAQSVQTRTNQNETGQKSELSDKRRNH